MKISLTLIIVAISIGITDLYAQSNFTRYEVEAQAIGTTNGVVPFWMRSNQYGSIPLAGVSGSFIGRAYKDYEEIRPYTHGSKLVDWAAGFQGRANLGNGSNLQLIEAYAKLRVGMFQLQAGRTRDVMGLNGDTTLSSGNFAVSGNALGIPKVEISIPEYWTIPWFDGLFAVKGNFAHGWVEKVSVYDTLLSNPEIERSDKIATALLHQKSLYGRIGKPSWRLKLFGGFNHQVFWGSESEIFGNQHRLSKLETLWYVTFGKVYGEGAIRSKIGNHIGSIDLGLQYGFKNVDLMIYRQNFYDVGALSKLANIRDGLNGIVIKNNSFELKRRRVDWLTFLLEVLYTKSQAGELWSKYTKSGDEDYYNNFNFTEGWSYKKLGLGTPLITTELSAVSTLAHIPREFFVNNRVFAIHIASKLQLFQWYKMINLSYSRNYGTYGTSPIGHSRGKVYWGPTEYGIFKKVNQFSAMLDGSREISDDLQLGYSVAWDRGGLLHNTMGVQLRISKRF